MSEYLYHLTGMCGEHWHPNLVNVAFITTCAYLCWRSLQGSAKEK